jgi:hypothetical protein
MMQEEQYQHGYDEKRRTQKVELARPSMPEPMSDGMTHSPEEEMARSSSPQRAVINKFFQQLSTMSTQLDSVIETFSSLQAQHPAAP